MATTRQATTRQPITCQQATNQKDTIEYRGRAMGTKLHIVLTDASKELRMVLVDEVASLEQLWSRFLPTSEISLLNSSPDTWRIVSAQTALLLARAQQAWVLTDGAFDATVLASVIASGYDRTFDEIVDGQFSDVHPAAAPGCGSISVDLDTNLVLLGSGGGFDPGAIGKGLAADIIAALAVDEGAGGVMINLGGDIVCRGVGPDSGAWNIALPSSSAMGQVICLREGAVVTSTTTKRCWDTPSGTRHHIIDPRTGQSSTGVDTVTVIAGEGWYGEAIATQVMVDGLGSAIDTTKAAALVADSQGRTHEIGDFGRYVR